MTDNNSTATELLPCPFCGGEAYTAEEQNRHPNDGWWDVRCSGCNAQIREECSEEGAIREWNTRIRAETARNSGEVVAGKTLVPYAHCCNGPVKYCDCVNPNHGGALVDTNSASLYATPANSRAMEWRDGSPQNPWDKEWFIAVTTYGDRVVLKALPEEYSYDFKTADGTYIMRDKIKMWMQFPDSQFIAPEATSANSRAKNSGEVVKDAVDNMIDFILSDETPVGPEDQPNIDMFNKAMESAKDRLHCEAVVNAAYAAAVRELRGTSADIGAGELDRIVRAIVATLPTPANSRAEAIVKPLDWKAVRKAVIGADGYEITDMSAGNKQGWRGSFPGENTYRWFSTIEDAQDAAQGHYLRALLQQEGK